MTDPSPPSGGPAANRLLSPQDWSLRVKLAIALLVPSLIAVVLGGLRVADQAGEAAGFDRIAQVSAAQGEVSTLIKRLQDERLRGTEFIVAGRSTDRAALQSSFAGVDAEQAAIRPLVEAVFSGDAAVVGAHQQAEQALGLLPQLRDLVLRSDSSAATAVARYSEVIDQVLPLGSALLRGVSSTEVNGLANALTGLTAARNEVTLQQAVIAAATSAREPNGSELSGLLASEARLVTSLNSYRTALDTGQRVRFAEMIAGPANSDRGRLVEELTTAGQTRPLSGGTGVRASKVYGDFLAEVDAAETGIRDELAATTAAARTTAVNLAVINVAVLLAALVIGAIIVGLIARAIISSLRTLRRSALEVAQKSLPDAVQRMRGGTVPDVNVTPVPVHTREEVGEVARAFDAVHAQAVRLAAEQATLQNTVNSMFVNLSRRSQSLVDRQLQLIEELESNEQDPDQLASLFRLDHLATRMRRNSENLLVLAGTELAKRSAHHVPVVDVLQAAVSEVEQYERVTVEQPPPVTVLGRAANDLQHLLSELLDNATSFSPPETQVTMTTSRAGNGPLVVEIIDRGIGMRSDELEDINKRFADADDSRMTASRRMGLFVVGRLAARHGVQVRLVTGAPTPAAPGPGLVAMAKGTGVTARVTIPAHLVASGAVGAGRRPEQAKPATALSRPLGGAEPMVVVPPQRGSSDRPRPADSPGGPPSERGTPRPGGIGARPVLNGSGPGEPPGLPVRSPGSAGSVARKPAEPDPQPEPSAARAVEDTPGEFEAAVPGPGTGQRNGAESAASDHADVAPLWTSDTGVTAAGAAADAEAIAAPELFGPSPVYEPDDVPTTRTPIFEEVASGWFRAYRQVPINWQPDPDGAVPDTIDHSQPVRPSAAAEATAAEAPEPVPSWPPVRPAVVPDDFVTAADDGWRAAVEARRDNTRLDTVPGTDLPRRTPGAQLLPGGIASGGSAGPAGSSRDAAAIRSRLSNYQRGVRSGRSERVRTESDGSSAEDSPTALRSVVPGAEAAGAEAASPEAASPETASPETASPETANADARSADARGAGGSGESGSGPATAGRPATGPAEAAAVEPEHAGRRGRIAEPGSPADAGRSGSGPAPSGSGRAGGGDGRSAGPAGSKDVGSAGRGPGSAVAGAGSAGAGRVGSGASGAGRDGSAGAGTGSSRAGSAGPGTGPTDGAGSPGATGVGEARGPAGPDGSGAGDAGGGRPGAADPGSSSGPRAAGDAGGSRGSGAPEAGVPGGSGAAGARPAKGGDAGPAASGGSGTAAGHRTGVAGAARRARGSGAAGPGGRSHAPASGGGDRAGAIGHDANGVANGSPGSAGADVRGVGGAASRGSGTARSAANGIGPLGSGSLGSGPPGSGAVRAGTGGPRATGPSAGRSGDADPPARSAGPDAGTRALSAARDTDGAGPGSAVGSGVSADAGPRDRRAPGSTPPVRGNATGQTNRTGDLGSDATRLRPAPAWQPPEARRRSTSTGRHELIRRPLTGTEPAAAGSVPASGSPPERPRQPDAEPDTPGERDS